MDRTEWLLGILIWPLILASGRGTIVAALAFLLTILLTPISMPLFVLIGFPWMIVRVVTDIGNSRGM